ncbi:DUF6480 family protein [Streptomyces tanashiensis]|uniref:DUF6480 family protein n=1 Tax=Streptomyces tanashiensis TaxID=67367 RepID=UPI0036EFFE3E
MRVLRERTGSDCHDRTEQPRPCPRALSADTGPGGRPPAETGTGTATGPHRPPRRGWATGPLVILWADVLLCALLFVAYAMVPATR